jgi:hypothetical protein
MKATLNLVLGKEEDWLIKGMLNLSLHHSRINKMQPISKNLCRNSRSEVASNDQTLRRTC